MADNLRRLLNLYALLLRAHEGQPLTMRAARDQVRAEYPDYEDESGRKAFNRDRAKLEAAGIPIRSSYQTDIAGAPGWWIPRDEYYLPGLALTDDERMALSRATRMVDFRDVLWAPLAGAKLGRPAPSTDEGAADSPDTVAVFVAPPALPALQDARSRRATVTFDYRGLARTVDPYGLANARGHWYLAGREHDADAVKVFRVDRVEGSVAPLAGATPFEVPADFDVRDHTPADLWGWGGDEPFAVEVAVDAEIAGIVAADVGAGLEITSRPDGRRHLRFLCTQRGVFLSWALGLGDRVEVLGPADLRAEIIERLRAIAATGEPHRAA